MRMLNRNALARTGLNPGQPKGNDMADDKTKTGKIDRDRINVNEDYELRYWSEKFDVTPERLKAAMKTSGPMVKDIAALLGKKL